MMANTTIAIGSMVVPMSRIVQVVFTMQPTGKRSTALRLNSLPTLREIAPNGNGYLAPPAIARTSSSDETICAVMMQKRPTSCSKMASIKCISFLGRRFVYQAYPNSGMATIPMSKTIVRGSEKIRSFLHFLQD